MDCLFCKIANNELPAKKIAENKNAIAFLDISPISIGHVIVIPKKHYDNLSSTNDEEFKDIFALVKEVTQKLLSLDIGINGFNYLSNENAIAGQVIMHFHMHVIPKYDANTGLIVNHGIKQNDDNLDAKVKTLIQK